MTVQELIATVVWINFIRDLLDDGFSAGLVVATLLTWGLMAACAWLLLSIYRAIKATR